jgi:hypothetical protein
MKRGVSTFPLFSSRKPPSESYPSLIRSQHPVNNSVKSTRSNICTPFFEG